VESFFYTLYEFVQAVFIYLVVGKKAFEFMIKRSKFR